MKQTHLFVLRFECGIYHRRKVDKQNEHCTFCGGCSAPMLKRDRMISCALDESGIELNESVGEQDSESKHERESARLKVSRYQCVCFVHRVNRTALTSFNCGNSTKIQ